MLLKLAVALPFDRDTAWIDFRADLHRPEVLQLRRAVLVGVGLSIPHGILVTLTESAGGSSVG